MTRNLGLTNFWNYLSGDTLTTNIELKNANQYYEFIKTKLLTSYKGRHSLRNKRVNGRLNILQYEKGETLFLYSSRVQILFGQAYPKKIPENSKMLVRKFIDTQPNFVEQRLSAILMLYLFYLTVTLHDPRAVNPFTHHLKDKCVCWGFLQYSYAIYTDITKNVCIIGQ